MTTGLIMMDADKSSHCDTVKEPDRNNLIDLRACCRCEETR